MSNIINLTCLNFSTALYSSIALSIPEATSGRRVVDRQFGEGEVLGSMGTVSGVRCEGERDEKEGIGRYTGEWQERERDRK